jgi:BlaI family penicillinase repressor
VSRRNRQARVDVTETELNVLKRLWEDGPSTIRQLSDRLYPGGEAAHYATVQKLLDRLQTKSWVSRQPKGRVNIYSASLDRAALIGLRLRETAEQLCEGSVTPLLSQLVASKKKLSPEEVAALRELVDRLDD